MSYIIGLTKLIFFNLIIFLAIGCVSVKTYNKKINKLHNKEELIKDIDFVRGKLQKLHPNLHLYISESELDLKFDSLSSTIVSPMTGNEFYFKLSPVISEIKQGHTRLFPLAPKLTKKESKSVKNKGLTPLSKLGYEIFDNRLYIINNQLGDSTLKAGTELISVNNLKPFELLSKYSNTFSSDGFNKTFHDNYQKKEFAKYFYLKNGLADSVLCELNYHNSTRVVYLKYRPPVKIEQKNKKLKKSEPDSIPSGKTKKQTKPISIDDNKPYYFKFLETDTNVAYMKIKTFSVGNQKSFYKKSFMQLNKSKANSLIIDLRDNFGGRLSNVAKLYAYLSDTSFYFVDRFELTSRTSFFHTNYLRGQPLGTKIIRMTVGLPSWLISMGIGLLRIEKTKDGKFLFRTSNSKLKEPAKYGFNGKVYVLINGGSFSASSILASNLKGSGRATFIGEETGGAYNGCVAGYMPVFRLPNSGLNIKFGIAQIQPFYKTNINGYGISPDIEITPELEDYLNGIDSELNRALQEIRKESK